MTAAVNQPAETRAPTTSPRGRDIAGRRVRDFRTPDASSGMLLVLVLLFNLLGLVMVLSASSVTGISEGADPRAYFDRQLLGLVLGAIAFVVTSRIHYSFWARFAQPAMVATYAALFGVLLFGVKVDGARRWLDFGPLRFQPSELAKLTLVLFIAHLLSMREAHIGDPRRSLNAVLVFFVPLAALVFVEPDLGTTIILAAIMLSMLFVAGVPLRPPVCVGRNWRGPRDRGRVRPALPGAPTHRHQRSMERPDGCRVADLAIAHRTRQRRPQWCGARPEPGEVGLPAQQPHRLHLRHHRRGTWPARRSHGLGCGVAPRRAWLPHRDAGA